MSNKKRENLAGKVLLATAGAAAVAGGIAAAVALSGEKNRKKVKKAATKFKAKADVIFKEVEKDIKNIVKKSKEVVEEKK